RHLAESRVLERSPSELLVYQRLSPPVIADRDVTLRVTWGEEGGVMWVRSSVANHLGPEELDGVVRIPLDEILWRLEPIDGGRASSTTCSICWICSPITTRAWAWPTTRSSCGWARGWRWPRARRRSASRRSPRRRVSSTS